MGLRSLVATKSLLPSAKASKVHSDFLNLHFATFDEPAPGLQGQIPPHHSSLLPSLHPPPLPLRSAPLPFLSSLFLSLDSGSLCPAYCFSTFLPCSSLLPLDVSFPYVSCLLVFSVSCFSSFPCGGASPIFSQPPPLDPWGSPHTCPAPLSLLLPPPCSLISLFLFL